MLYLSAGELKIQIKKIDYLLVFDRFVMTSKALGSIYAVQPCHEFVAYDETIFQLIGSLISFYHN